MDIYSKLYHGQINENERQCRKPVTPQSDEEYQVYEKLKKQLTEEQFELLNKFIELYSLRYDDALEDKYIQGFKTGLFMGIETANLKFN